VRDDSLDPGPVPASLMALWVTAVSGMEAHTLESFYGRIRRTWAAAELAPLEAAVTARRRALEGGIEIA
jgi:hypothetical protein